MKEMPISWLYGIDVFEKYSSNEEGDIREQMLEMTEASFLHRATTFGGLKVLKEMDTDSDHYPLVLFGFDQLSALVAKIQEQGFSIHNLEQLYLNAPLPEFRTVFRSPKGPVDVLFARPKTVLYSGVQTTALSAFFDCPIDTYFIYRKRFMKPRGALRISRMSASYSPDNVSFCQLYSESMGESYMSDKQIKEQINYYQDTGIKMYSLYLAVQYALMCDPNFLIRVRTRKHHLFIHDPKDPKKRPRREEAEIYDYIFGNVQKFEPIFSAPFDIGVWHKITRLFSKKGWIHRVGVFNQ